MRTVFNKCPICGNEMYIDNISIYGVSWKCWGCGYDESREQLDNIYMTMIERAKNHSKNDNGNQSNK